MVSENPRHSPGEQGNTATDKLVPHAGIRACGYAACGDAHGECPVPLPHTAWSTPSVTCQSKRKLHGIGVILMDHEASITVTPGAWTKH
jgi:hypothetical protein